MVDTRVDIVGSDRTGPAFTSANRSLSSLAGTVRGLGGQLTLAASALGVFAVAASIREVANLNDNLAKLSRNTGLAVETLAGLEFVSKQTGTSIDRVSRAINNFSKIVLEANGGTDRYSKIIAALGLNLEELKRSSPEQQFFALTTAINENVAAQDRSAVLVSLLGNRFAELGTLVNLSKTELQEYIAEGQRLNPVTQEAAEQSEKFNDSLDRIGRNIKARFLPGINDMINSLADLTESLATVVSGGEEVSSTLDTIASKKDSIQEVTEELRHIRGLQDVFGFLGPNKVTTDRLEQQLENLTEDIEKLEASAREAGDAINGAITPKTKPPVPGAFAGLLEEQEKLVKATTKTNTALRKQEAALRKQEAEAKRLAETIAKLEAEADPLIHKQQQLAELETFKEAGLSAFAYQKRLKAINDEYNRSINAVRDVGKETRQMWDSTEQVAIGAIRRIQANLSDGIFSVLSGSGGDLGQSLLTTLGRLVSDVASQQLIQFVSGPVASGVGSLFSGGGISGLFGGGGALTSIGAGGGGGGLLGGTQGTGALLSAASLAGPYGIAAAAAVIALNYLDSKFGNFELDKTNTILAQGLHNLINPTGVIDTSIAEFEKLIGTNFVTKATPAHFFQETLGIQTIESLIAKALFGLGPPKFNREEIVGTVTTDGLFEGATNQRFKQKGSLFKNRRISNFIIDTDTGELLSESGRLAESGNFPKGLEGAVIDDATSRALNIGKTLDEAFGAIATSIEATADVLGISTRALDDFNAELDLVSEKGEAITSEQVSQAIQAIGDDMVQVLIPTIERLSLSSETFLDALTRFGAEFAALENTLTVVGQNTESARTLLRGLSFEQRTSIVDLAGGVDALNQKTSSLFSKLSQSDQLRILEERLSSALEAIGVGFIPTLEEFTRVMISGQLSAENFIRGLNLQELIAQVDQLRTGGGAGANLLNGLAQEDAAAQQLFQRLSNSIALERNRLTVQYNNDLQKQNDLIQDISGSISELEALARSLGATSDQLDPLTGDQAREQIRSAITSARNGVLPQSNDIITALSALTGEGTEGFRSREDFIRARAESDRLVNELLQTTNTTLAGENTSLAAEQGILSDLQRIFDEEIQLLIDTLADARIQTDLLRGIDSNIEDVETAIQRLVDLLSSAGRSGEIGGVSFGGGSGGGVVQGPDLGVNAPLQGPSRISDQAIRQFLATNPSPQQLAQAVDRFGGAEAGLTSQRITRILGGTEEDRLKFFQLNPNIARFHEGGESRKEGLAIIKRDEVVSTRAHNDKMLATMANLFTKMDEVLQTMQRDTISNNRTSDVLEEWNRVGLPATAAA